VVRVPVPLAQHVLSKSSYPGRDGPSRARCLKSCSETPCLFGLAPCGVYHAVRITASAVGSYPAVSPLPQIECMGCFALACWQLNNLRRFIFCCTGRPADLRPPSRTLSGTLPCGVRTFLPLRIADATGGSDHPAACTGLSVAAGSVSIVESRLGNPSKATASECGGACRLVRNYGQRE
jgi:hypothetical protein